MKHLGYRPKILTLVLFWHFTVHVRGSGFVQKVLNADLCSKWVCIGWVFGKFCRIFSLIQFEASLSQSLMGWFSSIIYFILCNKSRWYFPATPEILQCWLEWLLELTQQTMHHEVKEIFSILQTISQRSDVDSWRDDIHRK